MKTPVADFTIEVDRDVTFSLPAEAKKQLERAGVKADQIQVYPRYVSAVAGGAKISLYQWAPATPEHQDRLHADLLHFGLSANADDLSEAFDIDGAAIRVDRLEAIAQAILTGIRIGRREGLFAPRAAGGSGGGNARRAARTGRRKSGRSTT